MGLRVAVDDLSGPEIAEFLAGHLPNHLLAEARARNYSRLGLETGSFEFFAPARALSTRFGFTCCAPFADYREDPNSVFMTKPL